MQGLNLVLLLVVAGSTSACKYFCRPPGTFEYECCDDGNPYFNEETAAVETEDRSSVLPDTTTQNTLDRSTQAPSHCYYYCAYDGKVYCCGDDSRPIPENHDMHDGRCPEEEEQVCKSTGVFLLPTKSQGKTSGAIRLVSGRAKDQLSCASDGYCGAKDKCCPSPCARKHICMKAIDEE